MWLHVCVLWVCTYMYTCTCVYVHVHVHVCVAFPQYFLNSHWLTCIDNIYYSDLQVQDVNIQMGTFPVKHSQNYSAVLCSFSYSLMIFIILHYVRTSTVYLRSCSCTFHVWSVTVVLLCVRVCACVCVCVCAGSEGSLIRLLGGLLEERLTIILYCEPILASLT